MNFRLYLSRRRTYPYPYEEISDTARPNREAAVPGSTHRDAIDSGGVRTGTARPARTVGHQQPAARGRGSHGHRWPMCGGSHRRSGRPPSVALAAGGMYSTDRSLRSSRLPLNRSRRVVASARRRTHGTKSSGEPTRNPEDAYRRPASGRGMPGDVPCAVIADGRSTILFRLT
jgi:hypothetical protein